MLERNRWFAARLRAGLVPLSCLGGLLLALALSCMGARLARTCAAVRADTLRLHIRAASDSVADQNAKLRVRDAVLDETQRWLSGADDPAFAVMFDVAMQTEPASSVLSRRSTVTVTVAFVSSAEIAEAAS